MSDLAALKDCCRSGPLWEGTPTGIETMLGTNKAYVTGTNKEAAVLVIHDLQGWKLENIRLLADYYAKEADATCYVPDFFDGESISAATMDDPVKRSASDLPGFMTRNSKASRTPELFSCARLLRSQYKTLGAVGFCFGGWSSFVLGARGNDLLDCLSVAHPSLVEKHEVENLGVPTQIIAPEHDEQWTGEMKAFGNETIPKLGLDYDYQYFPGQAHAFANRCDLDDPAQKRAMKRASAAVVYWLKLYLH